MSIDITTLLRDWAYEPGQINVRLIEGEDGNTKIQMRLDLGVLQMEVSGRPDGFQPNGFESLLDFYEAAMDDAQALAAEESDDEDDAPIAALSEDDCRQLREEAVQFYHRYISMLVLCEYDAVVRDTSRNLRVVDICSEFATSEQDREVLEQFRPYITMMRARALATAMITDDEPKAAMIQIDDGLARIKEIYEEADRADEFSAAGEVQLLNGMREELMLKLPASQKGELRQRLQKAIADENYELAAILRDELRMLKS